MDRDHASVAMASPAAGVPSAPRIALRPHNALPWLLLPQGVALEVLIEASAVRVPNTNAWFHGVVNQRGNLLPIFDLALWAGHQPADDRPRQIVVVGLESRSFGLLSEETPTLLRIENRRGHHSEYTGPLSPYLSLAQADNDMNAYEFDASAWLSKVSQDISRAGANVQA